MKIILLLLALLLPSSSATAAVQQNHDDIVKTITQFIREQTQGLPGKVEVTVEKVDPRLHLDACPAMEAFIPPGSHLLGNSIVGVRCPQTATTKGWTLFVPAHITVTTTLFVTSRPLPQGQVLGMEDFSGQSGMLTQPGILTDPAQITGKVLRFSVGAGQILRREMLRDPYTIVQGQNVPIVVEGAGFSVRSEGKALNNAAAGQNVQLRTASGRVVSGIAQENGEVVVRP